MDNSAASSDRRVKLGDFVIEKKVGEGGMGTVFMARQESLDRIVALKILPRSFAENPEFVERFRREARAAASLIHPNVVQVYSVGEERGVPYFAMEFVDGSNLDSVIKSGKRFTVSEAAEIGLGVAQALEAAHEKGLVHRDIKPANIMLDSKNNVKVTDFGLAKPSSGSLDITQPGLVVGTPTYMSPEQGAGEDVGHASDIYSLGVVLYEMLTGRVPFSSDNVGTIIYKHLHEAPEPPARLNPEIPEHLAATVLKCLAKKPEDRYTDPGQLVRALNAARRGDDPTDATMVFGDHAASAGPGPAPSDVTLPVPTPTPAPRGTPAPGTPQPAATMQPVESRKSSGALTGFLVFMLLVTGGAGGFYYYWFHVRPQTRIGDTPGHGPDDRPDQPGPGENLVALSLAGLDELLPAGSKVELTGPNGTEKIDLSDPPELNLPAGKYTISFSRNGYEDASWKFDLAGGGPKPELDDSLISAKPTPELLEPYEKAEKLLQSGSPGAADLIQGLALLAKSAEIDPQFRSLRDLRGEAEKRLAEVERSWQDKFGKSRNLAAQKRWKEAADSFRSLQGEIPATEPKYAALYSSIQTQINTADENHQKAVMQAGELRSAVRRGDFERGRRARDQIRLLSAETEEIKRLIGSLESAEKLWGEANNAFAADDYATAAAKFKEVLKHCPEMTRASEAIVKCRDQLKTTDAVARAVKKAQAQFGTRDYAGCLKTLAPLAGRDLGDHAATVADLRARAGDARERDFISAQLSLFDTAFGKGDTDTLVKGVLDFRPASSDFRADITAQARHLAAAGVQVSAWRHKLENVKVQRTGSGEPATAKVSAACIFELKLPDLRKTLKGSVPMQLTFNRVGQKWLLAAAAPGGKPVVKAEGQGPQPVKIRGTITAVDGKTVTIDRGKAHGAVPGMVFQIHQQARIVHLPLTGEKLFVEERPVASAEVIETAENSSRCSLAPTTPAEVAARLKPGMLVTAAPQRRITRSFPVVAGISASAQTAAAGQQVTVKLDVKPQPGVHTTCHWECSGGAVSSPSTAVPEVVWTAPGTPGTYKITATLRAPSGKREQRHIEVKGTGPSPAPPKVYQLEAVLAEPDVFQGCGDVAFDAKGFAYALDTRARRVVFFNRDMMPIGASERYEGSYGFERLAARNGRLYCLDARNQSVKIFDIGQTVQFTKEAAKEIGGRGQGNGMLSGPVDLAFSPNGELYVLDASEETASVQVFDAQGNFLQSFGSSTRGPGRIKLPVAVAVDLDGLVHVLDAAKRRVVSYENGRPLRGFECGPKTAVLTDMAYDAATHSLLVLDAAAGQAAVFSTAGQRKGTAAIGTKTGLASLKGSTRISASAGGNIVAVTDEGRFLSRFLSDGSFRGVVGGNLIGAAAKIAPGPRESFVALDTTTGTVRVFGRNGWMVSQFGDRNTIRKGEDLVCDSRGVIYVLDAGTCTVKAFDLAGRPQGTYGKKGRLPNGLSAVVDLATDGNKLLAVLCYASENSVFQYSLTERGRTQVFPQERRSTPAPKLVAVDAAGHTYVVTRKGQVLAWDANRASLGQWTPTFASPEDMEACSGRVFLLDSRARAVIAYDNGAEVARIKLPRSMSRPADLATSTYEVVFVYDSGTRSVHKFRAKR